jgi:hypothetical protein
MRLKWHRLQPVGFSPCEAEPPQAEACATKPLKQTQRIHIHEDCFLRNFFLFTEGQQL